MVDVANESQLLQYLYERNLFAPEDSPNVKYFSGGISGVVAMVTGNGREIIVKQALPALKVKDLWECSPVRIITEHKALAAYARIVPGCVPKPLFSDPENNIIGREAAPAECPMWKTLLLDGLLDFKVAGKAIDALCQVHNASSADDSLRRQFSDNEVFYNLRINPYIEFTVEKHPDLAGLASPIVQMLMNDKIALIHGDYSPKNILVNGREIFILDFEVAHFGHPSFDLAFFFNHFMLKAVKNKHWSGAYLNMACCMGKRYFDSVTCADARFLEKQCAGVLAFLLLARVDGKSPAEYIDTERDKALIRRASRMILEDKANGIADIARIFQNILYEESQHENRDT